MNDREREAARLRHRVDQLAARIDALHARIDARKQPTPCPWRLPHGPHEWAEVDLRGDLHIGETRWCRGVPSGGTVDTHEKEDRL